jgi:hypothetical protein
MGLTGVAPLGTSFILPEKGRNKINANPKHRRKE